MEGYLFFLAHRWFGLLCPPSREIQYRSKREYKVRLGIDIITKRSLYLLLLAGWCGLAGKKRLPNPSNPEKPYL